jgi:hypothetical protein
LQPWRDYGAILALPAVVGGQYRDHPDNHHQGAPTMPTHNFTTEQLADLAEAFIWHAVHRDKLMHGTEDIDGLTYQDAAKYRDEAMLRAGLPSMDIIRKPYLARIDAAVIARSS